MCIIIGFILFYSHVRLYVCSLKNEYSRNVPFAEAVTMDHLTVSTISPLSHEANSTATSANTTTATTSLTNATEVDLETQSVAVEMPEITTNSISMIEQC